MCYWLTFLFTEPHRPEFPSETSSSKALTVAIIIVVDKHTKIQLIVKMQIPVESSMGSVCLF